MESTHLGHILISIFPRSSDHPLQEVLSALSTEGLIHHDALHTLLQRAHESFTSPSTDASHRLKRGAAHALLGEDILARHELLPLLHDASDTMQMLATLLLGLLEMAQEHHLQASEHLVEVLHASQRDPTLRAHIVYSVLVWAMVTSLIKLRRLQEAYVLLTKTLETLSFEDQQQRVSS